MDHEYYQSRLSAFVDRELPADELSQVAEHIERCDDCAQRLAELQNLAELTSRHSELEETDYWEDAARRIEGQLGGSTSPVTDVTEPGLGRGSGFWWKLPAIAASVILVGYIGLHESDILTDDLMIPPAGQEAAGTFSLDDTVGAVGEESEAQPGKTAGSPGRGESGELGDARENEISPRSYRPSPVEHDALLPDVTGPVDRLQSEPAEESEPAPVIMERTVSAPNGLLEKSMPRSDSRADKMSVDSDLEGTRELRQRVAPTSATEAAEPVGYAGEADTSLPRDWAALEESYELDDWRRRRDSLVLAISDMEAGVTEPKKEQGLSQGFTADKNLSRGRAAEAVAARASLRKAQADLIEAWCHVCQLSENEAEISRGIGFLKDEAASEQSPHGEPATACLESLDRQ